MSSFTTLHITRSKAREVILQKVLQMTDSELEDALDRLLEPQLNNAVIVEDGSRNDDALI